MKKSTHGGKREGAGQKPIPKAPPIEKPRASGLSAQELAKLHLDLAIETLAHISANGVTEGARVSAAKAIVEIAKGDSTLGKKAAEEEAAMQAGRDSDWSDDLTVN